MPDRVGSPLENNLIELALHVRDGGDGLLNANDDIMFYAQGPRGFDLDNNDLRFIQNPYTNESFVWFFVPDDPALMPAQRMEYGSDFSPSASNVSAGRYKHHNEVDSFNGFHSGPIWHQTAIQRGSSYSTFLDMPNLNSEMPASLEVQLRGGNDSGTHQVALLLNQGPLGVSASWPAHTDITVTPNPTLVLDTLRIGQNVITIRNDIRSYDPQEEVWLDWIELAYGINLVADEDFLAFLLEPDESLVNVQLAGFTSQPSVLDISTPTNPVWQQVQNIDDNWIFTISGAGSTHRFVAATEARLMTPGDPTLLSDLTFADLRNTASQADYIIITDPILLDAAEGLAAIHSQEVHPDLRLTTAIITVEDVYEEFSGGMTDPIAIRTLLRWAYENWERPAPRLVALLGDGDYDYRNLSGLSHNLVPTIQVDGTSEISSRTVDDRFVYLDSVWVSKPLPDMGIGRIAVSSPDEGEAFIERVRNYMVNPEPGSWRQRILLAADDPARPNNNETYFITETESYAQSLPPYLQLTKLYLTEYPEVLDPATNSVIKPDATADLIRLVNQGVSLINYVGHGSSTQWAQEQLLKLDRDRALLHPGNRLAVWFAGTCTWGRFDQLQTPSMSEVLTATSDNSAIAVISAVRAVYAGENFRFIRDLFNSTFPGKVPTNQRIGEILQQTKRGEAADEKFHLFGDPALLVAFPRNPLTVNPVQPDTLVVLDTASFSGSINNETLKTGECLVTVLDAPHGVTRQYQAENGAYHTISYMLPGARIFEGSVSINANGTFNGQFIIPKDISYDTTETASLIAYGWAKSQDLLYEEIGFRDDLIIGGFIKATPDTVGPLVAAYWQDRLLVSNDAIPGGAEIEVQLVDPQGINLTGEIGHSIRLWVDDESTAEVMNSLFQYEMNSYTTGGFPHQIDPTLTGRHEIFIEAWDGGNNKTLSQMAFHLELDEKLNVAHLYNYPNPFTQQTEFVYTLSIPAKVTITVFTLNGTKVRVFESAGVQDYGFQRLPEYEPWNGRDAFGDPIANGTYLYRFKAETTDGETITEW
ncbi:type IX secretion system sortase PorU, partial [Candidatus Neomarinimicrobiota bacterium]